MKKYFPKSFLYYQQGSKSLNVKGKSGYFEKLMLLQCLKNDLSLFKGKGCPF